MVLKQNRYVFSDSVLHALKFNVENSYEKITLVLYILDSKIQMKQKITFC